MAPLKQSSDQAEHLPNAIIHSMEGSYTEGNRMKSGGHGQDAIDYMDKNGIEYNIVKTYPNGVRIGNVPNHMLRFKRNGNGQAWFPKEWTQKDIVAAAEHVIGLKSNSHKPEGTTLYGQWKDVKICVIRRNGSIASVYPNYNQSCKKRRRLNNEQRSIQ